MSWKRLLVSAPLGFLIMIADGLLLILVNRLYLPGHPPHWMTGTIFYFDAWPVLISRPLFSPNHSHRACGRQGSIGNRGRCSRAN